MKIVVLGGQGFIGQHLMKLLRVADCEATSLSRRTGCDLLDLPSVISAFRSERPDCVVNCAGRVSSVHYGIRNAASIIHDNVIMVLNAYRAVQEACPKARVVNPISNCSYPGDAEVQREEEWCHGIPHDSVVAFGSARRFVYAVARSYQMQHGTVSVNLIVPNAYGPGDYLDTDKVHALNGIILRLIAAKRRGDREFEIWGTGKPLREWGYAPDIAQMLTYLATSESLPELLWPLNMAQKKAWSIAEIAQVAAGVMDYPVKFVFNTKYADGAPIKMLDDSGFRKMFPDFRFTDIRDGIRATVADYESRLPSPR